MKLLFQLSGEHPDLPRAEVLAVLEAERRAHRIVFEEDRILVVDVGDAPPGIPGTDFLKRLALSTRFGEFLSFSGSIREASYSVLMRVARKKTIAVRSKSHRLEEGLGAELSALGYMVDLDEPDVNIIFFEVDDRYLTALGIPVKRNFAARRPQFRPYFHPTSMHPKLARVLVNLARVRKGDQLLDPFCGTGGILIEAGLMGMTFRGSDIDPKMVKGCKKNLEAYGLWGEMKQADALALEGKFEAVDAIVTDPPYARSSYVSEKNLESFYKKFLSSAAGILRPAGHLVLMIPRQYIVESSDYIIREEFCVRVHKSLTRRILVLRKP